jgi:DMSO/TMAO reductase YedYZ molybdopterin-dependent catalytic subunit
MSEPPGRRRRERPDVARVQRPTSDLPVVHLEDLIPSPSNWLFSIEGLVASPKAWTLDALRALPVEVRTWDLHCVWGWTRPSCRWEGVSVAHLLRLARPLPSATFAMARQIEGPYASCFSMQEASDSMLAWRLDGEEIPPEHGGPLRFVPPPNKWGYKSVKWVGRLTLLETFIPGFWEEMVGNPRGDIPPEKLDLRFEEAHP